MKIKKKMWTIVSFALILGISAAASTFNDKRIAVETASDGVVSSIERPVIVLDAGHGGVW